MKRGQVWRLGKHYLMCGDATDKADVTKLLRGGASDRFTINRSTV
jgi:hypothetical protein